MPLHCQETAPLAVPPDTVVDDCLPKGDVVPPTSEKPEKPEPTFHNKPRVYGQEIWKNRTSDTTSFAALAVGAAWNGRSGH